MWIFYFLFWTAVKASAEEPLYRKIGDQVVLTPDSVENPITSIRWKHGDNIAMQWNGDKTLSYRQFKVCGSLNISTGVMTITGLTRDLSGIYTAEINGKKTSQTELLVFSPVPKPTISVSCEREMTYCVLTCSGNITDTEPVTYWWTAGEKRWTSTKEHKITKDDKEEWFICTVENPVSSNSSEKVLNPFMESNQTWMYILIPAVVFILVVCIIIVYFRRKYKKEQYAVHGTKKEMEALQNTSNQDLTSAVSRGNSNEAEEPASPPAEEETSSQNRTTAPPETSNETAAESLTEEEWSTTLKPTTSAFWRKKHNDKSVYTVTRKSIRHRVALLITNIEFTEKKMNRKGAEKDEQNMEKLLTALGYEVVKYTNLTGKEIEEAVIDFSKHQKLKETDSVFVVIMSHGILGAVLGVDYKKDQQDREQDKFPIDDIYTHLDTEHCPNLLNKPKIIIIQACRGDKDGAVLVHDYPNAASVSDDAQHSDQSLSADEEHIKSHRLLCAHKEKDFICFLSCTPDTVSYRHTDNGSLLIQYIVDVLNTFAHQDHIEELFRRVMQRFEEDFPSETKKQMPTKDRCTLIKNFYLFPRETVDGTEQEMTPMLPAVQESFNHDQTSVVIRSNSNRAEDPNQPEDQQSTQHQT